MYPWIRVKSNSYLFGRLTTCKDTLFACFIGGEYGTEPRNTLPVNAALLPTDANEGG